MNYKGLAAFAVGIILTWLTSQANAQFEVRNFSVAEGLPSSETYYVFQDKQGFIWIATDQGVVRFDGYDMTVFRATDGLEDPVVFGISEDHRGRIWFRTYSGRLFFYEAGKIYPYQYNNILVKLCLENIIMTSMYMDSQDQLWFLLSSDYTTGGRIDNQGIFHGDSIIHLSPTIFVKTIETERLTGFLGGWRKNGLRVIIDGKNFNVGEYIDLVKSRVLSHVIWRGGLYISMDRMVFRYDGVHMKKILSTRESVISMFTDSKDGLWLGYSGGVGAERYQETSFRNPWKPDFLVGKSVSKVISDKENGLWMTTLESGVFFVPNSSIQLYTFSEPSKVIHVTSTDNEVLFNTLDRKMTAMDAVKNSFIAEENAGAEKWAIDKEGNILMPIDRPFRDPYFTRRMKYVHGRVIDYTEDKTGNVWVLSNQGLSTYDQGGNMILRKEYPSRARCMLMEDSTIYLGERLGLQVLDAEMRLIEAPKSLSKFRISKILRLNPSYLLTCTVGNGFLLVNEKDWTYEEFGAQNGFLASNVYAAHIRDSTLWMGTEKGVFIADVQSILKRDPTYIHFSKSSGLIADQVNFLALTGETAWAFSDEGISIIPYQLSQPESNPSQLYFKQLLINGKPVKITEQVTLPHDSTNISLTYGFLSLKNQNFVCRYRLTKDDPWVYPKVRNLQFSSLAPNDYQLELEYSVDNFHWKSAGPPFQFSVLQPWWRQWYVQLGALIAIAGLIFLYLKNHFRMLHRHRLKLVQTEIKTLERERSRIAKELHDGVATNLGAIKLMANYTLKKHDQSAAQELDEYFVTTINEIKGVIYGLTPPELERDGLLACLKNYTEKLNRSFPHKIHLVTNGQKDKQPEFDLGCFRIIQELLSNASKHSFSENIFIQVDVGPNALSITFKDDGVGFEASSNNNGLGLSHLESRVQSLNGELKMETGSNGTAYSIHIPNVTEKHDPDTKPKHQP
jgi:signal transduction histidine kinase/ligand-binding sensor domain-containing protein